MNKLLFLAILLYASVGMAQSDIQLINQTLSMNEVKAHIDFLASDELKGRQTGSPEIDIAAKYLATQMSSYGAKPVGESYFQEVSLKVINQPEKTVLKLKNEIYEDILFLNGVDMTYNREAIFIGFGNEQDFNKYKVKGRLVIAKAGYSPEDGLGKMMSTTKEKRKRAFEMGASGLIELVNMPTGQWQKFRNYLGGKMKLEDSNGNFMNGWMLDETKTLSSKLKQGKKLKASLEIDGLVVKKVISKNVVATIKGSDPDLSNEYVAYSAHYDHMGVGKANADGDSILNGARDNAVGVATMLSTAKHFLKHPPKRSALFVFATAEEKGLLGSEWFITNCPLPPDQIVFNLNSDNAGYNDMSAATIIGFGKTTYNVLISEAIEQVGLNVIADPMPKQNLYERSDNVHFARSGIPSVNISMGITDFDDEIKKVYHNVADNPETLDYGYLEKYFRAYLNLARKVANNDEAPFWVEGDKFYNKGIELYKK